MTNGHHSEKRQSLGVLLLKIVFPIYLAVTLTLTATHMYSAYSFEKQRIEQNLVTYQSIFGQAVATALWNLDNEQLMATLNGATALKDIAGILLLDTDKLTVYQSGFAPQTAKENTFARNTKEALFYKSFHIKHRDRNIGSLYLYSSDSIVFDQVKYNLFFILANTFLTAMALWFAFLWAFKRYLVDALEKFIAEMRKTDLDTLQTGDHKKTRGYLRNSQELVKLDQVFDSLKQRLQQSRQALEDANLDLESTVDKRTELLRRQQSIMESMSQQANIGAWEYNVQTDTVYWSKMTRTIFEVDSDYEPSPNSILTFFDQESATRLQDLEQRAIKLGIPWEADLQITTAKGHKVWIASTGEAEVRDGKCIRLFGSFQDIDQQVSTHEQLSEALVAAKDASRTKDEFLARISHELRTPMNGIIGMLSLLLNTELDEKQTEQAQISLRSAESLLALLDDLLDISRIETGQFALHKTEFDLYQLLEDQLALWQPRATAKGLEFKLDTTGLHVPQLQADPYRLQQILANLISNAIKFSDKGEIEVRARSEQLEQSYRITFVVKDTGIGIDESLHTSIFDTFVQEDNSSSRKHEGAGLGLSIVKELVGMMDGQLSLESAPGQGSRFLVELTVPPAPTQTPNTAEASEPAAGDDARSNPEIHLLVVEDNPVNQTVAKAMLENLGMQCDIAEDGLKALECLTAQPDHYALILMDCQMPRMDGYDTTRAIRQGKAGEGYRPIPIVAMTANAMTGDREKCLKSGMHDYVSKPVTLNMLEDILNCWINRSQV